MSISPDGQGFCQSKNHVAPAVDSLREEFRKYLENGGLPVVLTRVIKDIYEKDPKPTDPLGFFVNILGAVNFYSRETTALKDELLDLKALVKSLEEENKVLREKLEESVGHFAVKMVRVKFRYFLAEILTERYNTAQKLPLQDRDLRKAILEHVQNLFGDYGYACINGGYSLKMFNPVTRIFIVRVHRKHQNILRAALPLLTVIDGLKLSIRLLHLSGTIRSSMKFLVQYDREKLSRLIQSNQLSSDDSKQLSDLVAKYQNKLSNIGV